ncbi:unnamed protein product, partial [Ectocarpus fasciculatus]
SIRRFSPLPSTTTTPRTCRPNLAHFSRETGAATGGSTSISWWCSRTAGWR